MTLVSQVFDASDEIKNTRSLSDVFLHLSTEFGELAQEVQIAEGKSYKEPGSDGVVGEGIDVIACTLDLIRLLHPGITEETLDVLMKVKLDKWKKEAGKNDQA
jgi:NTP pyrophosphatase (non-canonical NTP hydrolase)